MGAACRLQSYSYFKFGELSTILHTTEIIMTKRGYIYHAVLLTALASFVLPLPVVAAPFPFVVVAQLASSEPAHPSVDKYVMLAEY